MASYDHDSHYDGPPTYHGIESACGTLVAYGFNRSHLLSELSRAIAEIDESITIYRDVGSRFGDHFVMGFFIRGPSEAIFRLAEGLEAVGNQREKLRGIRLVFLPQIDYRYGPGKVHRHDINIKLYIRDRTGIQHDLVEIFDQCELEGVDHFGRVVRYKKSMVYHGNYTLSLGGKRHTLKGDARQSVVRKTVKVLRDRVCEVFPGEIVYFVLNGEDVQDKLKKFGPRLDGDD